jgi:hypothetical protein
MNVLIVREYVHPKSSNSCSCYKISSGVLYFLSWLSTIHDKAVHRNTFGTKVQVLQDMNLAFKVQTLQSAKFLPKTSIALKISRLCVGLSCREIQKCFHERNQISC